MSTLLRILPMYTLKCCTPWFRNKIERADLLGLSLENRSILWEFYDNGMLSMGVRLLHEIIWWSWFDELQEGLIHTTCLLKTMKDLAKLPKL